MTEKNLTDLLTGAAARVPVGAAPLDAITGAAGRRRRTRAAQALLGSAAVVAVAIAGTVVVTDSGSDPRSPAPAPAADAPPAGFRYVGLGHAAIAVPESWGFNETACGTPTADTVVINDGPVCLALVPRLSGVESVEITSGRRGDLRAEETLTRTEINGVKADRSETTCLSPRDVAKQRGVQVCHATVYLPGTDTSFRVTSSTSAEEVDEIVAWIRVVPDLIGIPDFPHTASGPRGRAAEYAAGLEQAGLAVRYKNVKRAGTPPGYVLGVSPEVGTMVTEGTVVTVTQVGEPDSPADEVSVGVNSNGPGTMDYTSLEDPQIRAGGRIELRVGDEIWAYASAGPQRGQDLSETLAATLAGTSLQQTGRPGDTNYPNSWKAIAPGRTTITLTITDNGTKYTVGTVEVVVSPGP